MHLFKIGQHLWLLFHIFPTTQTDKNCTNPIALEQRSEFPIHLLDWIKYINCLAKESGLQWLGKLQKNSERKLEKHNKNHCCSCSMEVVAVDPPSDFSASGSLWADWFRAKCTAIDSAAWGEEICLAKICVNINQSKVQCCSRAC